MCRRRRSLSVSLSLLRNTVHVALVDLSSDRRLTVPYRPWHCLAVSTATAFATETDYNVHVYMRQDGLAGTVTADLEYPPRVAFVLLTQASRRAAASRFTIE